jgi:TetR/AcrR family transcriptional regulator, transcriptional repressor for nem operon
MSNQNTRDHIIGAADQLFYRQGYEHTSFSDIANVVKISRGNFYFHFKTKDEILDAVINRRLADTRKMLDRWEIEGKTAADRIRSFIHILIANRADIKRYGCPVGTLCSELGKLNHAALPEANELFTLFRTWLRRQFVLLGRERDADALAMHLLARSQGVATLASSFQDENFIRQEVDQMRAWLDACAQAAVSNQGNKQAPDKRVERKGRMSSTGSVGGSARTTG